MPNGTLLEYALLRDPSPLHDPGSGEPPGQPGAAGAAGRVTFVEVRTARKVAAPARFAPSRSGALLGSMLESGRAGRRAPPSSR